MGSAISLLALRARPLASLGAVITILALAFDPFIQQILQYPSIPTVDHDKESSVVRTSAFAIDPTSTDWLNAISACVWSGPERFAQQPSCPSGNCKWDEYWSTSWCSKCQDAISYAKITDCNLDADKLDIDRLNNTDSCSVDFGHGNKFQVLGSYKTYNETQTAQMSSTLVLRNISDILRSAVWPLSLLNHNLSIPLANQTYVGVTNPILALGNVHVQICDEAAPGKGLCITLAEECVLSLCTRRYETSVVDGIADVKSKDEDFGCLSQVHADGGVIGQGTETHCWQVGKLCDSLHFTDFTSFDPDDHPEFVFCPDGVVVQTAARVQDNSLASIIARPTVQGKILTRLTVIYAESVLGRARYFHYSIGRWIQGY